MYRLLPMIGGGVLLLAYGLAEGYWTNRWSLPTELAQAPARLAAIPRVMASWEGEDDQLDPRQARRGEIQASLLRRYTNRVTGEQISVLLVCGRPGPIAVHSPAVCLGGAGYILQQPETVAEIPGSDKAGDNSFWVGRFVKPEESAPELIELHWSWNARGDWQAVQRPRLFFARERLLYKLYVSRALSRPSESVSSIATEESSTVQEFLKLFLPEVKRALFPGQ